MVAGWRGERGSAARGKHACCRRRCGRFEPGARGVRLIRRGHPCADGTPCRWGGEAGPGSGDVRCTCACETRCDEPRASDSRLYGCATWAVRCARGLGRLVGRCVGLRIFLQHCAPRRATVHEIGRPGGGKGGARPKLHVAQPSMAGTRSRRSRP
eukprot:1055445-Prymnesium_polylepis.1